MKSFVSVISARLILISLFVLLAFSPAYAIEIQEGEAAEETGLEWPRVIDTDDARIVVYQPQVESYKNNILEGLAAVSVTIPTIENPVFGAFWFASRMETDRDERVVTLVDLTVTAVKFPEASQKDLDAFSQIVETEIPKWNLTISLDRLIAGLELVEMERAASANLNNDPPKVIYSQEPTVLVLIEGDPILRDIENTKLKYIVNTPFFIVYDTSKKTYYLKGGDWWYSARNVTGDWKLDNSPPREAVEIAKQSEERAATEAETGGATSAEEAVEEEEKLETPPKIIVSTVPAELIISDGIPSYQPINETGLLYMSDTDSDVLMDINTQTYYVLLAGRWYQSSSLEDGDWTFIPPDEVPEDFNNIPPESDKGNVRVSVAGTQEAKEAVLENEIPQTAVVDRSEAIVEIAYDGDPTFEWVGDTDMQYAVNTDKSVLLINGRYYCCDEAVWFIADGPTGPWVVCVDVPVEVQTIPPECPVYNVKYVYVYDYTPEVVYVGYTPGYTCSYVYHGCVVYGTGYWYRPWYHYHYYPRPVTYGFGVHWNPWTGWGFPFGVSYGWFTVRMGWGGYYGGWWGPAGYRHGYYHGYRRGYYHGAHYGYAAGYRHAQHQNMYKNRKQGVIRTQDRQVRGGTRDVRVAGQPSTRDRRAGTVSRTQTGRSRQNDVYADRNGNVYRRTDKGWEQRSKDGWSSTDRTTRDRTTRQRQTRESTSGQRAAREQSAKQQQSRQQSNLDRQAKARDRGSNRTSNYRSSKRQTKQKSSSQRQTRSKSGGGRRP